MNLTLFINGAQKYLEVRNKGGGHVSHYGQFKK